MNIPPALVMQQLRALPLFGPMLADKLQPADIGVAVTVALGVLSETGAPAVPHLREQQLPWLARGAVVAQILGKIIDTPITLERTETLIETGLDTLVLGITATPAEALAPKYAEILPKLREKLPQYQAMFPTPEEAKQLYQKVQQVASDAAARIKDIVKMLFKAPAPASVPAAASASSETAAPAELPLVLRFLRDSIAHVRDMQSLPAVDSVVDLAAIEKVKDEAEITLKEVNLTFKQLEAMGKMCKNLKKLHLGEGVTLAGSKYFDSAAVEFFFEDVEVTGAPCTTITGNMHELLAYNEALGVSKEQLWTYVLSLHRDSHAAHADLHEESHQKWVDEQTAALKASAKEEAAKLVDAVKPKA